MTSSNKFLNLAHELAIKKKLMFDQLLEFEHTGKIRTKSRLNFTVNRDIAIKFKRYCRNKGYNMSAKVEQAMKELVEN